MGDSPVASTSRLAQFRRLAGAAVRDPRSVRYLPRLARSIGRSTLELRLPWLPFQVIDLLAGVVDRRTEVFEFGGGGSTAWFADRAARVVTVEDDPDWSHALNRTLGSSTNIELRTASPTRDHEEYVAVIDDYPDLSFDVVVVDGRQRVRCFERAIPKVKHGGLLILDDADRHRYQPVFDAVDWPRTVYVGYAPCKDDVAHTAIFVKP